MTKAFFIILGISLLSNFGHAVQLTQVVCSPTDTYPKIKVQFNYVTSTGELIPSSVRMTSYVHRPVQNAVIEQYRNDRGDILLRYHSPDSPTEHNHLEIRVGNSEWRGFYSLFRMNTVVGREEHSEIRRLKCLATNRPKT